MSQTPETRNQLAQRLLNLEFSISPITAEMDKLKDRLRALAAAGGYVETIPGFGTVSVGAASKSKLTGVVPTLSMEKWIELPLEAQFAHVASGLIVNEKKYSANRKSAVSITLDPNVAVSASAAPTHVSH
jgi:hypothetical protein